jgi:ABC-type Fe3+ transport system substrate-binding protein
MARFGARRAVPLGRIAAFVLAVATRAPAFAADDDLVAAAKREGHVTWYTTQIVDQLARPAAKAFQSKYGIAVDFVRGDSGAVGLRVLSEHKAGRTLADVVDGTSVIPSLEAEGLLAKWLPDDVKKLPNGGYDQAGYWVATNEYLHTPVFNTTLVRPGEQPKTFDDLLDPKWKGKMVWASHGSTSGASGFVGMILTVMGEDKGLAWLRRLARQNVVELGGSARSVADQVIAGEYPLALQVFNHQAVISAAQGAPVDWIPMSPSMGIYSVTAVLQDAPHPHAGRLFEDFLISSEGQNIFRNADYIPVDPAEPPKVPNLRPNGGAFKAIFFSPEQITASIGHWSDVYKTVFE